MAFRTVCVGRRSFAACVVVGLLGAGVMLGWGAVGHRLVAELALSMLPKDMPGWLREAGDALAYQVNEPDRWRGTRLAALTDANGPDHYMDVEKLAEVGLTLETLPRLRSSYIAAVARRTRPGPGEADTAFDPGAIGMLPYAIAEHYAKLVSSMNSVRIIESLHDADRRAQLAAARANVIAEMGRLGHFVGDAGQPLHTTIHHHGWVGANPHGYTTSHGFHSAIDSGIVEHHAITLAELAGAGAGPAELAAGKEPGDAAWDAAIGLIERSFAAVEPLYELDRTGELEGPAGRRLIAGRLGDAGSVLAGLYRRAWLDSAPTPGQVADWVKYNAFEAEKHWAPAVPAGG